MRPISNQHPAAGKISYRNWMVFRFIDDFKNENDYAPTIREIVEGLGVASAAPIQHHLNVLKEKGCIDWVPRQARTITRKKSRDEVWQMTDSATRDSR